MTTTAVDLSKLGLSAEQLARRRRAIGGSDANILMSGDDERIYNLWPEKRGERQPDDLSDVLIVQMGSYLEPFTVAWFEKVTGRGVISRGREERHASIEYMACTLDGMTVTPDGKQSAVFEAKFCQPFNFDRGAILLRYMPQLTHNAIVTGVEHAVLACLVGSGQFHVIDVEIDPFYAASLLEREREFWECVQSGKAPNGFTPVRPVIPASEMRTVDMTGSNEWASHAADWLEYREPAKRFDAAAKSLKSLVADDVCEAHGHGIRVKRNARRALTISEDTE